MSEITQENVANNQLVVKDLKSKLQTTQYSNRNLNPTIFRVSPHIRSSDEDAYEPKIISFGPYHHDNPRLAAMETVKLQCMRSFISRKLPETNFEAIYATIETEEQVKARNAYSVKVSMDSKKFVEMLLLDGCFIVEFFIRMFRDTEDLNVEKWVEISYATEMQIISDMVLLENQIPFFLLEKLYHLACRGDGHFRKLVVMALFRRFPQLLLPYGGINSNGEDYFARIIRSALPEDVHHILHCFHALLIANYHDNINENHEVNKIEHIIQIIQSAQSAWLTKVGHILHRFDALLFANYDNINENHEGNQTEQQHIISINQINDRLTESTESELSNLARRASAEKRNPRFSFLDFAGIEFKVNKNSTNIFSTCNLHERRLHMSQLRVDSETCYIFRNLIAFEQHYRKVKKHVSMYCLFMNSLILDADDVSFLARTKIIVNAFGSNENVAELFNKLCKGIHVDDEKEYDLYHVFKDLRDHADKRMSIFKVNFLRDAFANPSLPIVYLSFFLTISLLLLNCIDKLVTHYTTRRM